MKTQDYLKTYMLKRIHELEEAKRGKGIVPDHVGGREARGVFLDDLVNCAIALRDDGLLEQGNELNDIYFRLTPENALEE